MQKISIITASTRPARFGAQVSSWIYSVLASHASEFGDTELDLIDLAEVDLPFFDEDIPPGFDQYRNAHTLAWAERIAAADGFVWVSPEYNHSYNAALKNAIDYLYKEWNHKPLAFVCYGGHAGGTRAVEHLRSIAGELKMYDIREMVLLPFAWNQLDQDGNFVAKEQQSESAQKLARQIIFWTREMKASRERLARI